MRRSPEEAAEAEAARSGTNGRDESEQRIAPTLGGSDRALFGAACRPARSFVPRLLGPASKDQTEVASRVCWSRPMSLGQTGRACHPVADPSHWFLRAWRAPKRPVIAALRSFFEASFGSMSGNGVRLMGCGVPVRGAHRHSYRSSHRGHRGHPGAGGAPVAVDYRDRRGALAVRSAGPVVTAS